MKNNNLKSTNAAFVNLKENETVARYVKDIMSIKPLKAKEEYALFEKYNDINTSDIEKSKIREEIFSRNQRFVYAIAKRYSQDELLLDLISEGNIGMIEAFNYFDYKLGHRFCTFAVWYIRRSINAYITTGNMLIKKSNNTKTLSKIMDIQEKFFKEEGRFANYDELKIILEDEYGVKIKDNSDLFTLKITSINMSYDDEDINAFENSAEFVSHATEGEEYVDDAEGNYNDYIIDYLKGCLDERELEIINLTYSPKEYNNKEIGEIVGLTGERVRQIRNVAIEKMKHLAENCNFNNI